MLSSPSLHCKANTRCGGESLNRKCCRRVRNWASASFHSVLWGRASSQERSMRTQPSTSRTSAISFHALHLRLARPTRPWLICCAKSPKGRTRHLLKLRLHGCWPRSPGLFPSPAQRNCIASRRTSAQLKLSSPPTICVKSIAQRRKSMCREHVILKRWSEGRVCERGLRAYRVESKPGPSVWCWSISFPKRGLCRPSGELRRKAGQSLLVSFTNDLHIFQ